MRRQQADIGEMVFGVGEILAALSRLYTLAAGDLIFTGTPAGVGPLVRGDGFRAGLDEAIVVEGRVV